MGHSLEIMRARAAHFNLFCLLFFFLFSSPNVIRAEDRTSIDVGVILDTSSWIGNISWSCMPMALEDFYAKYPNYTTRLNLHLRDSGKTAFGAAASALDLLKNVQVQAIIGPQTSTQAKFVSELGKKTHVPVISFSAKSPSVSHQKSSYFIRTGFNDSCQTKVIASIVKAFKWKEAVLIYEDTVYGNGIVPYLVAALQEVEANVPYRGSLPLSATKDQIMAELDKLKSMQTRVFVVHTTYHLGFQLFNYAKEAGMMEKGYVWITTYGLTDIVDLMGSSASDVMHGVIGVKPYVKETSELTEFKLRWRKKFSQANPHAEVSEPTVFGLWAYDTVWALAQAVEDARVINSPYQVLNTTNNSTDFSSLGSSLSGPVLLNQMLDTKFDGISGEFILTDGQLESKGFEIFNFVGHGKTTIGYWSTEYGISGNVDSKKDLKAVTWPGGQNATPKGWEWPTMGKKLRIGVPVKPGFDGFVRFENDNDIPKGYCIEVFDAAMAKLPYHVPYKYYKYANASGSMNGTYDDLVYQVFLKNFDAVVGDITIIANRSLYVDFTLPYTESGVSMVVPVKDKRQKGAWTFLDPLTTDLWLAGGAFFIFTGVVVWFIEHRINDEFRGTASNQIGTIFYFAFSTLVFAHREKVMSNLSRFLVIIWVFAVLVLQSSYTASLSSMLTVEQLRPTVTDIDELLKSGANVGYLDDSFMPGLLKRLKFNESRIKAYQSPEQYNEALSSGAVAAIFDEIPYLKVFRNKYCNKYALTGQTYKTDGFGFVFPIGSPLVPDISRAVLQVREGEDMNKFENELYEGENCPDTDDTATTSSSLRVRSFWGLFLITGVASLSALIAYTASFLWKNRDLLRDSGNSVGRNLASLAKAYDRMDPSSAPKKPEVMESPGMVDDSVPSPYTISGPVSPSSISNLGGEYFGTEGVGTDEDEDDEADEATPGREIRRQNPDPPSFADMLTERAL